MGETGELRNNRLSKKKNTALIRVLADWCCVRGFIMQKGTRGQHPYGLYYIIVHPDNANWMLTLLWLLYLRIKLDKSEVLVIAGWVIRVRIRNTQVLCCCVMSRSNCRCARRECTVCKKKNVCPIIACVSSAHYDLSCLFAWYAQIDRSSSPCAGGIGLVPSKLTWGLFVRCDLWPSTVLASTITVAQVPSLQYVPGLDQLLRRRQRKEVCRQVEEENRLRSPTRLRRIPACREVRVVGRGRCHLKLNMGYLIDATLRVVWWKITGFYKMISDTITG